MANIDGSMMTIGLLLVLTFGFVMDGYAVFLRVAGARGLGEVLAMANLVQYIARISNVLVIFVLSFAFETGRLSSDVALIFLLASALGLVFTFALVRSRGFCNLVTNALRPVLHLSFRSIARNYVWRQVGFPRTKSFKLVLVSACTNALIIFAMYVPFGIASHYPDMRMTSVYFGQLINFFATLVVFSVQDPISMRLVDSGEFDDVGSSLIFGRVVSYAVGILVFASILAL
jgi:hypothetical protein